MLSGGERSDPLWGLPFFRGVVGGPRSGGSALLVAGSSVPGRYKKHLYGSTTKRRPSVPGK